MTIRPPESITEPEKFKSMREYGIPTSPGHAQLYEYDHLIPLELGGAANSPENLWPQSHQSSFTKDRIENKLNRLVCGHHMPLATAQRLIARDWRNAP